MFATELTDTESVKLNLKDEDNGVDQSEMHEEVQNADILQKQYMLSCKLSATYSKRDNFERSPKTAEMKRKEVLRLAALHDQIRILGSAHM